MDRRKIELMRELEREFYKGKIRWRKHEMLLLRMLVVLLLGMLVGSHLH